MEPKKPDMENHDSMGGAGFHTHTTNESNDCSINDKTEGPGGGSKHSSFFIVTRYIVWAAFSVILFISVIAAAGTGFLSRSIDTGNKQEDRNLSDHVLHINSVHDDHDVPALNSLSPRPPRENSDLPEDAWSTVEAGIDAVDQIAELVASYPDTSSPKEMMEYAPALKSFRIRPSREDSDLPEDDWNTVENGVDALDKIAELVDSYSGPDTTTSPRDIMESFQKVAETISIFVPEFALVGAALSVAAALFLDKPEAQPDPLLVFMDERFKAIETELSNLIVEVDMIKLNGCKLSWDDEIDLYITKFESSFKRFSNANNSNDARASAKISMESHCIHDPPHELMGRWNREFVLEDTISGCFKEIKADADNRVLYFHREWVGVILKYMMQAAQYQGICDSMTKIKQSTTQHTTISDYFYDMHAKFQKVQDGMYASAPSQWKATLDRHYKNAIDTGDSNAIFKSLKEDFFPDFKYAVSQIGGLGEERVTGEGDSKFGSFKLGEHLFVMYRSPRDKTHLSSLKDVWTNLNCPGRTMCTRKQESCILWLKCEDVCELVNCNFDQLVHENTELNNRPTWELYKKRGVFFVKTQSQKLECVDWRDNNGYEACFEEDWIFKKASSATFVGDQIYEKFESSWEEEDNERSIYTIVGVSGDFPSSDHGYGGDDDSKAAGKSSSGPSSGKSGKGSSDHGYGGGYGSDDDGINSGKSGKGSSGSGSGSSSGKSGKGSSDNAYRFS